MLQKLPVDVLLLVLKQVTDKTDLKQLCEVSKTLYGLVIPRLYENIIIKTKYEAWAKDSDVEPFLRMGIEPAGHLRHVKSVKIVSRFHQDLHLLRRCYHNRPVDSGNEDDAADNLSQRLGRHLMPLFNRLRNDTLESFSWELGTCIPSEIINYLQHKQDGIKTLSLITGGPCDWNIDYRSSFSLYGFRFLQNLSWINVRSRGDLDALFFALAINAERLRRIHLDLIDWTDIEDLYAEHGPGVASAPENFFAQNVMLLEVGGTKVMYPELQSLSLGAISFHFTAKEMLYAFNISKLRSLTLRNCPGAEDFLDVVIDSRQPIQLKSLELLSRYIDLWECQSDINNTLPNFLGLFKGLESLYISHPRLTKMMSFWRSLAHHKSTLKHLVCHPTAVNANEDSEYFGEQCDVGDLFLSDADIVELNHNPAQHPFKDLNLEYLGLCCEPTVLKSVLLPYQTNPSLKVLHIRRSGPEMVAICPPLNRWDYWPLLDDGEQIFYRIAMHLDAASALHEIARDNDNNDQGAEDGDADDENDDKPSPCPQPSPPSPQLRPFTPICTTPNPAPPPPPKLVPFAQIAFSPSPSGYPGLRLLCFGDFSYSGRFAPQNVVLCRDESPPGSGSEEEWVPVRDLEEGNEGDSGLWRFFRGGFGGEGLGAETGFLDACPLDGVLNGVGDAASLVGGW